MNKKTSKKTDKSKNAKLEKLFKFFDEVSHKVSQLSEDELRELDRKYKEFKKQQSPKP